MTHLTDESSLTDEQINFIVAYRLKAKALGVLFGKQADGGANFSRRFQGIFSVGLDESAPSLKKLFHKYSTNEEKILLDRINNDRLIALQYSFDQEELLNMYRLLYEVAFTPDWISADYSQRFVVLKQFIQDQFSEEIAEMFLEHVKPMQMMKIIGAMESAMRDGGDQWCINDGLPRLVNSQISKIQPAILSGKRLHEALEEVSRRYDMQEELETVFGITRGSIDSTNMSLGTRRGHNLRTGKYVPTSAIAKRDFE